MTVGEMLGELNLVAQAKKYGVPLWQYPQFLFLLMGGLIAVSALLFYLLGRRYIQDPHVVALLIIALTAFFLAISFVITRSFERLAEVARLKTEFVGIVSHQLRSPLSNLKWTLEVLMKGQGKEGQAEYLKILQENTARMEALVQDLLLTSQIEEGKLQADKKEFSLPELVKDVTGAFAPWTRAANIEVKVEGDAALSRVVSDPLLVRQVLENLLDNAVRYARKGEDNNVRAITVSYAREGKSARVEVRDNGVGIPAQDQKFIFHRFFRSRNASRQETQGSGLGLYIAKAMVKRLGGDIGFESAEGKGSKFWFTIPTI